MGKKQANIGTTTDFRNYRLLLGNGELEVVRGVGTLRGVPHHFDHEVADWCIVGSFQRELTFGFAVLDPTRRRFDGNALWQAFKFHRDILVERFVAANRNREGFRLTLFEGGRPERYTQGERVFFTHTNLDRVAGIGTLGGATDDFYFVIAHCRIVAGRECEFRVGILALNNGLRRIDRHTLWQTFEHHSDVLIEVRAAFNTNGGLSHIALLDRNR